MFLFVKTAFGWKGKKIVGLSGTTCFSRLLGRLIFS